MTKEPQRNKKSRYAPMISGGCLGSVIGSVGVVSFLLKDGIPHAHGSGSDMVNGLVVIIVPAVAAAGAVAGAVIGALMGFIVYLIQQRRRDQ